MGGPVRSVISKPKPPPAPAYVAPSRSEVSQATATDVTESTRGKGRSSMIATGPQGLGSGDLKLQKRTLLG
jgi:hypothetical protein